MIVDGVLLLYRETYNKSRLDRVLLYRRCAAYFTVTYLSFTRPSMSTELHSLDQVRVGASILHYTQSVPTPINYTFSRLRVWKDFLLYSIHYRLSKHERR